MPTETTVPLETVAFSGSRYVAQVDLGVGRRVPLMVHGNARLFLSLTHTVAEQVVGRPVVKREEYGYTARGRGSIHVPTLNVGGRAFGPVPDVPVFDFSDDREARVQGMLGTGFLRAAGAVVDFGADELRLGGSPTPPPGEPGRVAVPMRVASDGRVVIEVAFPGLGLTLPIVPSTVADALTLHAPPFTGLLEKAELPTPDRSPRGTRPVRYEAADPVEFLIGGIDCRSPAVLEDLAEYGAVDPAELGAFGMLGYDWMKPRRAVIDYRAMQLTFRAQV